jgi:hypothetical protein
LTDCPCIIPPMTGAGGGRGVSGRRMARPGHAMLQGPAIREDERSEGLQLPRRCIALDQARWLAPAPANVCPIVISCCPFARNGSSCSA